MKHEWLTTTDAAQAILCHPATLANWRYQRRGPPYERRQHEGRMRIVYRKDRLLAWSRRQWTLEPTKSEQSGRPTATPFD